jgi:hypothetical protein
MRSLETVPIPVSHSNIPTDLNVSPDPSSSYPCNLNLQRCSHRLLSSHTIEYSIFAGRSQALEITAAFFSNPLLTTPSNLPSIMLLTAEFLTLGNNQLEVSMGSVKITSIGVSGGGLITVVAIICLCFVLDRRHNSSETEE